MDDERIVTAGFHVTPDAVAGRTFTTAFRGYDQSEVRAFLKRVSEDLAAAAEREAQLRRLLQDAQNRAEHPEVDEAVLTNALGEHAARLLASAREQAANIRTEAEAKASRMLREAEGQIARIRSEADSLLARRVEEVDGVTTNLRNAAEADARALREQARADVEAELQAARAQGREMVAEARAVRERILADLARRRHVAEVQLDQLRAARERLLSAYSLVRRTLDEATQELKMAEVEARLAADEAGRRAPTPPPAPPDVLTRPAAEERKAVSAGAAPAGSPAAGGAGSSGVAAAVAPATSPSTPNAPRLGTTALRMPRTDPSSRTEPRLRPPKRPDDARPSPPNRRPDVPEPVSRESSLPPFPGAPAAPGPQPSPAVRGRDDRAREPATDRPPSRPAPARASAPSQPPAPQPPSIVPRPVPPPPPRPVPPSPPAGAAPAAPAAPADPDAPKWSPPSDRVDELFARIKADRAGAVVAATPDAGEPAAGRDAPGAPKEIDDESARARRDELLDPIEESLTRQLKRVLQDEQNEVLDRLRRKRRRHNGAPLPRADEQAGRFREVAESILEDAVRAGVRFADPTASEARSEEHAAREVAQALAVEIADPLHDRLDRTISESGEDRESPALADAVSAVYRQWRAQELEPLVRHQAAVAFGRGAFAAAADGAPLRWVVDDDGPCPDCDDNSLAGAVLKGEPYPTGQLHPPAHPGCRCLLVPAGDG